MGAASTSGGTTSSTTHGIHPASNTQRGGLGDTTSTGLGSGTTGTHGTTPGTHGIGTSTTPGTHGTGSSTTPGTHGTHGSTTGSTSGYGVTHTPSGGPTSTTGVAPGEKKKPSLLDKLNPMKDTDKDGKKGFMD